MDRRHSLLAALFLCLMMPYVALLPEEAAGLWSYSQDEDGPSVKYLQSSSWLSGWAFRKLHNVTGSAGAGTDYQIYIVVHNGSGIDSDRDVYCGGVCQPDFDDIRFTDDDGVTLLHYWREKLVPSDNAAFWVEIADNLNSSVGIYVYYGSPVAQSASDGNATFTFFDDFVGDLSRWSLTESGEGAQVHNYEVASSKLHVRARSESFSYETSGYMFETKRSFNSLGGSGFHVFAKGNWDNLPEAYSGDGLIQCLTLAEGHDTGLSIRLRGESKTTVWVYLDNRAPAQFDDLDPDYQSGEAWLGYYVTCSSKSIEMRLSTDSPRYGLGYGDWLNNFSFASYKIRLWATVESWSGLVNVDIYYDYVFLAKWVPNEPYSGTWGAEEQATSVGLDNNAATVIVTVGFLAIMIVFWKLTCRCKSYRSRFRSWSSAHLETMR